MTVNLKFMVQGQIGVFLREITVKINVSHKERKCYALNVGRNVSSVYKVINGQKSLFKTMKNKFVEC